MSATEYVLLEYNFGESCVHRGCESHLDIVRPIEPGWRAISGQVFRADSVLGVGQTPVYLVSLDAAIEAAAKAFCRIHLGDVWDSITEPARDGYRDYFRDVLTAAVMGAAQ